VIATVTDNEVDPGIVEDIPGEFPEILARFNHGRFYLDHIDRFHRVLFHRAQRHPAPQPDHEDVLRALMKQERQVPDQQLRGHVSAFDRGIGLAVYP